VGQMVEIVEPPKPFGARINFTMPIVVQALKGTAIFTICVDEIQQAIRQTVKRQVPSIALPSPVYSFAPDHSTFKRMLRVHDTPAPCGAQGPCLLQLAACRFSAFSK